MITQDRLKELLSYDPLTGVFLWRVARKGIQKGAIAGYIAADGYRRIRVDLVQYKAHRLARLYMKGAFPTRKTDHRNGIRHDNKWTNLRDANNFINSQNKRVAQSNNKAGFLGVSHKGNRFFARIGIDGKEIQLGAYDTPQEAHCAYLVAKRTFHEGCTI